MTDANVSGDSRLRDARPDGLCTQTFFRNHDVIRLCLRYASLRHSALRVWDIGGGVLEPLLIASLCELLGAVGRMTGYEVVGLDASPDVATILEAARQRKQWYQKGRLIVDVDGRLRPSGMAHVFSATHADLNTWLSDPVSVGSQLQHWLDLGLGPYFAIPTSACHSQQDMEAFLETGLLPCGSLFDHLQHVSGDIISADQLLQSEAPFDVVMSNFALQYPIWEGRGEEMLEQIERHLAPGGILQVANAYSAQQEFIGYLAGSERLARTHYVEISMREAFIVSRYATDAESAPARLVPRMDVFCTPEEHTVTGIDATEAEAFTQHTGGQVVSVTSLEELDGLMREHTGLEVGGKMVYHGHWDPKARQGYACLLDRDTIVAFGRNPLRAI